MARVSANLSRGWRLAFALLAAATAFAEINTFHDSPSELAAAYAKKAKKADKAGHAAQAYLLYSEAAALQPGKRIWRSRMEALQSRALEESRKEKTSGRPGEARSEERDLSPDDVFDSITERELADARPLEGAALLKATAGSRPFDLGADARSLWDSVARAFGLEAVYDGDYPKAGPPVRFRLDHADYREAMHDLEAATGSFAIPLSSRIFMVAKDTPQKRQELEQTLTLAIPIPTAITTQELTEIAQTVRQTTDVQKIAWDSANRRIVMRDRVSRVLAAEALVDQLLASSAETLIDVEYIELTDSDVVKYGFNVTSQFSAFYLGRILNNVPNIPSGITNLLTFGGGKTLIGLTAAQVQALFNQTLADSRVLFSSQVRAQSGQAATFHVGERYPVITQGYFGSLPANQQGHVYAPPPAFTYEDLGIAMKITPRMHDVNEMTLSVETSYEVLTGQAANGIPVLGSRKLKTDVRVRDSEWTIVAGMTGSTRSKAVSGFWGLEDLPMLGDLFKQTTKDKESSYVLIGVRPHLLSLPPSEAVTKPIAFGTETRTITPL